MSIGRNDACPCGSGKKHKKCCLGKAESPARDYASIRQLAAQKPIMGEALAPYSVLKLMERSANPEMVWTRSRVAAMVTEDIEARLVALGVAHSRERFLTQSEGIASAWALSELWFTLDKVDCLSQDEDFLGIAACELWVRLLAARPSVEMADDWIEEGYRLEKQEPAAACQIWWKAWSTLRSVFTPAMTTMDSTTSVFNGMYLLSNWCESFREKLALVGQDEQRFCSEWLTQFGGEEPSTRLRFGAAQEAA